MVEKSEINFETKNHMRLKKSPLLRWTRGGQLETAGVKIGDGMRSVREMFSSRPVRRTSSAAMR